MKKLVIITGGTGDLGQSIIDKFYENNYRIYFTYFGNEKKARLIEEKYPGITAVQVDIRD